MQHVSIPAFFLLSLLVFSLLANHYSLVICQPFVECLQRLESSGVGPFNSSSSYSIHFFNCFSDVINVVP